MQHGDIDTTTVVGVYGAETGDYHTLGGGFSSVTDVRDAAADAVADTEYVIVSELAHVSPDSTA